MSAILSVIAVLSLANHSTKNTMKSVHVFNEPNEVKRYQTKDKIMLYNSVENSRYQVL